MSENITYGISKGYGNIALIFMENNCLINNDTYYF